MIHRPRPRPLTAAAWRQLVHASIEDGDMEEIMKALIERAKVEQGAAELVIRYTAGMPYRCPVPVERLELPDLVDLEQCAAALNLVLQAESEARISSDQARSYRETITATANVFRGAAGHGDEETYTEMGSTVIYTEAGKSPVDAFREAWEQGQESEN